MLLQFFAVNQKFTSTNDRYASSIIFQSLRQVRIRRLAMMFSMISMLFILMTPVAFAQSNDSAPDPVTIKHAIITIQELEQQGIITHDQAEKSIAYYLAKASRATGHTLTLNEIMATPDPTPQQLTPLQQFAGAIDFVRIILVLGIIATVGAVAYLFKRSVEKLLRLLKNVPVVVYEGVFYAASLGCGIWGWLLAEPMHQYIGLSGCLLFVGALGFSAHRHRYLASGFRFSSILFLVWTLAALLFGSSFIGFIAVGALLSALSFRILLTPYGLGFRDEITVRRATVAAFEILALFIGLRLVGALLPALAVFEFGALFLGSLVGYTGLLILSSRWHERRYDKKYLAFQGVAIIAGVGALFFGSVFHIDELQKIGGTFFVVYFIVKLCGVTNKK